MGKPADSLATLLVILALFQSIPRTSCLSLFGVNKEYRYNYETLVTAGQELPSSFASAYKIKGILKVNAIASNKIDVALDNLTIGIYNGPWAYFPIPAFDFLDMPELSSLGESFQIEIENGKFKTLILNDLEPEWASNMKRGLATFLQMDFSEIKSFDKMQVLNIREMSTLGECTTKIEVLPANTTPNRLVRINKFRNHADCPDIPTRTRLATQNYYQCSNKNSRDIMNSTSYSTYELELEAGNRQPVLKSITLFSSLLFWPFTTNNAYQFSWLNMTITFDSSTPHDGIKTFPPPENAETHEDLMYVFEQPDPNDAEDENPDLNSETLFFHHGGPDVEPETMQKIVELVYSRITQTAESLISSEPFLTNSERFHADSTLSFLPLISSLDYDHLTKCYKQYSSKSSQNQQKFTELQLFLDGLIISGTSQSTLLLRDILISPATTSDAILRIVTMFPYYIRNPTEAVAKEMDVIYEELFNCSKLSTMVKRTIELSMASVIGRCCKKTLCTVSGLLDKYIEYFETKFTAASTFEGRTAAILGLRNLEVGKSLDRVIDIATGSLPVEQTVRVQAIWSLSSLAQSDPKRLFDSLLPVFYNRSEHCEIRTSVFTLLMGSNPDKRILHDIAYFIWTEHCPQTFNIVRSFLSNAIRSKVPCNNIGSYAKTILNYLPPGFVDPLRTTIYSTDYFDDVNGFGHQFYSLVQKSGTSALPISMYFGVNNYIGGFAGTSFGVFIRLEGVEKAVANKIASIRSVNIEQVQKILSQINLTQRRGEPLRLELIVVWQNHVIAYYAADENSVSSSLPIFVSQISEQLSQTTQFSIQQSLLLGGVFHQLPLEIGTPVSISVVVIGSGGLKRNVTKAQGLQQSSHRLQLNLFGRSTIANHAPGIGTMHGVTTRRAVRLVLPRNVNFQWDSDGFHIAYQIPTGSNPILLMTHGSSLVSVGHDSASNSKQIEILELLQRSCPQCQAQATVSRGDNFRQSRNLLNTDNLSPLFGTRVQAKIVDCERDHSDAAVMKQFNEFFSEVGKNTGVFHFAITKLLMTSQHVLDYLFWSPSPETCGFSLSLSQDDSSLPKLETIDSVFSTEFQLSDNNGASRDKIINGSVTSTVTFNYASSQQQHVKSILESTMDFRSIEVGINGTHEVNANLRFTYNGKGGQTKSGSLCVNAKTLINHLPTDVLSYQNENEPSLEQILEINYGVTPSSSNEKHQGVCLSNIFEIKINGRASRSFDQIAESEQAAISPYKECAEQIKNGGISYGDFVPPTLQCFAAALEQTSLRNLNTTIYYKVSKSLPPAMIKFGPTAAGLFYSLSGPNLFANDLTEHQHNIAFKPDSASDNFHEGVLEVDVIIKKDSSVNLDVHHSRVQNGQLAEESHSNGITLLNQYLRPNPIPARFSPYLTLGFQSGFLSQCTVTSNWITTLDSFTYNANLSSDCSSLMSADCSQNPQYALTVTKLSSGKIGLNIQFGSDNIKLSESEGKGLQVTLNGKATKLPNKDKYNRNNMFILLRNENEVYVISSISGIHIRYTGYFATITLDSRYRGVHCGLCGNWDSNFYNDLLGPNTSCPIATPQSMVEVYSVANGDSTGKCSKMQNNCTV